MFRLLLICALFTVTAFYTLHLAFPLQDKVSYSTLVTDNKGELIHAFLSPDEKWRLRASLNEISPVLRKTIVRKEDKYFYFHSGVNPVSIARAFLNNIFHFKRTSGASTITMQVARALERKPRTYGNKLVEIFRAWQLEIKYSKNEILQLYCNLLPYGGNIEGVKAASLIYLQKDPDHLSLAEITALSIIPNRPSSLLPGKTNELIRAQRDVWLRKFAGDGVFSEKEIEDALAEPFNAERKAFPRLAPQFCLRFRNSDSDFVRSSLDLNIQSKSENIVSNYVKGSRLKRINNASVVIIDNQTNQVIAYVASADFTDSLNNGQVDGISSVRQPGSALKPFLYAMCIDDGLMTPRSAIADVNVNYAGYSPENFNRKYNGYVSVEYALEHSLNIPAVKALNSIGVQPFVSMLARADFKQVRRDNGKLGLSMILGGCGATLLELTGLYAALANGGMYHRPVFTSTDTTEYRYRIASEPATFMITEILSKINRPDFPINWQSTEHMPKIAWKTGTSYGRRDGWSIGYNRKYTVGVWTGNFSGEGSADLSGAETATPLLFRIFNTIAYDADEEWFTQPQGCDIRIVCAETGMPPAEFCLNKVTDYFIPMTSPVNLCNNYREEIVSADRKTSFCRTCMPSAGYRKELFQVIPPEMRSWMDDQRIAYQKIPPHNAACERLFTEGKPAIISPRNGSEYLISLSEPEPIQLQCKAGNDVSTVYWYINNKLYKSGNVHTPLYFVPSEGPVKVSCTDDKGRNQDIWIRVKLVDL